MTASHIFQSWQAKITGHCHIFTTTHLNQTFLHSNTQYLRCDSRSPSSECPYSHPWQTRSYFLHSPHDNGNSHQISIPGLVARNSIYLLFLTMIDIFVGKKYFYYERGYGWQKKRYAICGIPAQNPVWKTCNEMKWDAFPPCMRIPVGDLSNHSCRPGRAVSWKRAVVRDARFTIWLLWDIGLYFLIFRRRWSALPPNS